MASVTLTNPELQLIDDLVNHYKTNIEDFRRLAGWARTLFYESEELARLIHSMKSRVKDPEHLRDKLLRKARECKEECETFEISKDNLFDHITDLAGFRILHLHTEQFQKINEVVLGLLGRERWQVVEGPKALVWDEEYRKYFEQIGVETIPNERLYTSVHYLIKPTKEKPGTCELQVRTLAEELWGEVDHTINYPYPSSSTACREQIKVLARMTSGCTRLVDSIFNSHQESLTVAQPAPTLTAGAKGSRPRGKK